MEGNMKESKESNQTFEYNSLDNSQSNKVQKMDLIVTESLCKSNKTDQSNATALCPNIFSDKAKENSKETENCANTFSSLKDKGVCFKIKTKKHLLQTSSSSMEYIGDTEMETNGPNVHICLNKADQNLKTNVLIGMKDSLYSCGSCSNRFRTICQLHDHLQGQHEISGGSYHYVNYLKTAFPKYDTFCRFTQTDACESLGLESYIITEEGFEKTKKSKDSLKVNDLHSNVSEVNIGNLKSVHQNDKKNTDKETCEQVNNTQLTHINVNTNEQWPKVKIEYTNDFLDEDIHSDVTDDYFNDAEEADRQNIAYKILKQTGVSPDASVENKSTQIDEKEKRRSRKQAEPKSLKKLKKCAKKIENARINRKDIMKLPACEIQSEQSSILTDPLPDGRCKCDVCGCVFSFRRGLLRHEQMKHYDEMTFQCQLCEARFMREFNLQKHIKCVHTLGKGQKYKKVKNENKKLENSIKMLSIDIDGIGEVDQEMETDAIHTELKEEGNCKVKRTYKKKNKDGLSQKSPHTCNICGHTMPRSKMGVHERLHSGERPYICELCGKGLISQNKLTRHMLTHSEKKKHTCDVCGVGFQMKYKLRMHQHIHTGKKPYLCSVCGAEFNHSSNLATHTRCVHLQVKPYECTVCGGRYAKRSQLDDHVLSHSTEKQFTCRYCGKSFKYYKGMRRHEKNHFDDTDNTCNLCNLKFSSKVKLQKHKDSDHGNCNKSDNENVKIKKDLEEIVKSDSKVFHCLMCGKVFLSGNPYYTHMLAAHNVDRDQEKRLHYNEQTGSIEGLTAMNTNLNVSVDPNLPLQLGTDLVSDPGLVSGKETASGVNNRIHVDQMVTGILHENRQTLQALTRVATENLRLHSEDIREEEKINALIQNPLIVLNRNQLPVNLLPFTSSSSNSTIPIEQAVTVASLEMMETLRLQQQNQESSSREVTLGLLHGGHLVSDSQSHISQSRHSDMITINPMLINQNENLRVAHDLHHLNIGPVLSIPAHNNRTLIPLSAVSLNETGSQNIMQHERNLQSQLLLSSPNGQVVHTSQEQSLSSQSPSNSNLGYSNLNLY